MASKKQKGTAASGALKKAIEELLNAPAYTDPIASYRTTLTAIEPPKDETPVAHERWEQLYEVAKNIRLLEPWKYLHESERITLLLPGRDEPVYIVVMGSGEMTYGIGIYPGYNSLQRLLKMTESSLCEDDFSAAFEQHCINLYFGDREELEPQDKDVIKKLGLKFRGKNEWPYFRSMRPGFMPWYINSEEAELVIAALQNFVMAAMYYIKQDIEVDFEGGETLLRFYDAKADMWYNTAVKMPPEPVVSIKLTITNDILVAKLKKKRKTSVKLGFGLPYIPVPIQERKNQRPRMPRLAILINLGNGKPADYSLNDGGEFIGKTITDMLVGYITDHGRPASIAVPDEDTGDYILDFAEKLGIELIEDERFLKGIQGLGSIFHNMPND